MKAGCMKAGGMNDAVFKVPNVIGWQARLELVFTHRLDDTEKGKTVLSHLQHYGPLRVQRPFYPESDVCHVYLLHPPSGLVGGDSLEVSIHCTTLSHCLLTTPGSSKFYRSAGAMTTVKQTIKVDEGASLEWFPQENIFFPGALAVISTDIYLHANSSFIGWEITCLGRPVNNEQFLHGSVDSRFLLHRDGKPILLERLRINQLRHLQSAAGLRCYPMQATFIATPCDENMLELVRELIQELVQELQASMLIDIPCAVTLVDGVLVLRILGNSTEKMQAIMIPVWQALRPLMLGKSAVLPRIWST